MGKFLIILLFMFSLCSCGRVSTPQEQKADSFLSVVESNAPIAIRQWNPRSFVVADVVDPSVPSTLTPKKIIDYIKQHDLPSEDVFEIERAEIRKEYEIQRFLPMVLANFSMNYPVFGYELQYYRDKDVWENLYAYITVVWSTNFISLYKDIKKSEVEKTLSQIKQTINKEQLAIESIGLYYQICARKKEINTRRRSIELKRLEATHTKNNIDSQFYTSDDLIAANVEISQLEIGLRESEHELFSMKESLKELLELQHDPQFDFASFAPAPVPLHLDDLLQKAADGNTRVKLARLAAKSLREADAALKYERFSNFNIYLGLPQFDLNKRRGQGGDSMTVGFHWSIPLFDAGETDYKQKESAIQKRQLSQRIHKEMVGLERALRRQFVECEHVARQIQSHKELLGALQNKHEYTVELGKIGQAKYADVLKSEIAIMQKELDIFTLECKLEFGLVTLAIISGEISL